MVNSLHWERKPKNKQNNIGGHYGLRKIPIVAPTIGIGYDIATYLGVIGINIFECSYWWHSPSLVEEFLLFCDIAFITDGQVLHCKLGILLVSFADGSFVWLELDNIYNFVWSS